MKRDDCKTLFVVVSSVGIKRVDYNTLFFFFCWIEFRYEEGLLITPFCRCIECRYKEA